MTPVTVRKFDHNGALKFEYDGEIVERGDGWVCLRASFMSEQADMGFAVVRRGDVFTEWHYAYRWYNVFQINGGEDGALKGWYCNITRPAVIVEDGERVIVSAEDLALDVFVMPDGEIHVLDEDEFKALRLPPDEQAAALDALEMIYRIVAARHKPFDLIAVGR